MSLLASLLLFAAPQTLPPVPVPAENPMTPDKVLLGKVLFWDEQLSSTDSVACGTCHIPGVGGVEPRSTVEPANVHLGPDGVYGTPDDRVASRGVAWTQADGAALYHPTKGLDEQVTARRSFSMINSAFFPQLFWDGRAGPDFVDPETGLVVSTTLAALEAQALAPILSDVEMGHVGRTWAEVDAKLTAALPLRLAENLPTDMANFIAGKSYPDLFALAFAGEAQPSEVNARRIAQAIAAYQRTLISDQTPYDDFLGGNLTALSTEEKRGRIVFEGPGNCIVCHAPPILADFMFQNTGVRPIAEDAGRFDVTGQVQDRGRFRTTPLRNVTLRERFFHNGQFGTLDEVVDFYIRGGDFFVNQSTLLVPLNLTAQQRQDLITFLDTALLDQRVANELPPFDRPTLFNESSRRPELIGNPTPGTGGLAPETHCIEPPYLGNPSFSLGLTHSASNLPVFFAYDPNQSPVSGGAPFFGALVHLALGPGSQIQAYGLLSDDGNGGGWTSLRTPLPSDPLLAGMNFFSQWFVLDPGATQGLAASPAVKITLF